MIREDSEQTYFKKGSEQCGINKYRSIDDFITISKNYFFIFLIKLYTSLIASLLFGKGNSLK